MDWAGPVYFICFGIIAVAVWWWFEKRRIRRHQLMFSELRPNLSDDDFRRYFSDLEIGTEVVDWVRNEVSEYKYTELSVHWDDELFNFYRIDGEELENILDLGFEKFNIPKPSLHKPLDVSSLRTVKDLVIFLNGQSQNFS